MLKVFKITQNHNIHWDTYCGAVVIAENAEEATLIHPNGMSLKDPHERLIKSWTEPKNVKVEYIGVASPTWSKGDVIIACFTPG